MTTYSRRLNLRWGLHAVVLLPRECLSRLSSLRHRILISLRQLTAGPVRSVSKRHTPCSMVRRAVPPRLRKGRWKPHLRGTPVALAPDR
jgi:hypothetical protein